MKKIFSYFSGFDLSVKRNRRMLWLLSFIIYFGIFYFIQKFNNSSLLYGDEWEYQSQAVNFAKGLGFPVHGGLLKFEEYKFLEGSNDYVAIFTSQNMVDPYRTPLFPLFAGIIYFFFGVNPYVLKMIQLAFYVIIACGLPLIGWNYWKKKGYLAGILAGICYIATTYQYAGSVLTEPLVSLVLYLIIVFWIRYDNKNTFVNAVLLGLLLGVSWLTKGILMPLACFIMLLMFVKFIRQKKRSVFYKLLIIGCSFLLPIAVYSIYLNTKLDKFVLISTQGEAALLDSHNEYMKNGFWAPDWRQYPNSFYNTDQMKNRPAFLRVINFYKSHPKLILKLAKDKLLYGFMVFYSIWLLYLILLADGLLWITGRFIKNKHAVRLVGYVIFIGFLSAFARVIMLLQGNEYILNEKLVAQITSLGSYFIWLLLAGTGMLLLGIYNKRFSGIPNIFIIIFTSFVIMVVLTCLPIREIRYIKVIDFMFILTGILAAINFILQVFQFKNTTRQTDLNTISDAI